jgi:hypothetical protein
MHSIAIMKLANERMNIISKEKHQIPVNSISVYQNDVTRRLLALTC